MIYVAICQGCKDTYIGETGCLVKKGINIYRQHIRQTQYQQLVVQEHLRTCRDGKFHMFPFFKILQENTLLRKSYEDYFIDEFKPSLNKKTLKVTVLNMASNSYSIPRQRQIKKNGGFCAHLKNNISKTDWA